MTKREKTIIKLIELMTNDPSCYDTPTTLAHWIYDNFDKISKIIN